MSVASIEHIEVDNDGTARIIGQRTKVVQIVMDTMANDWRPDEIHAQYSHLSLAQIHAALAYYYDHQKQLDAQSQRDLRDAEQMRDQAEPSPIAQKLRSMGKLPSNSTSTHSV